jgi:hypothetical protein
MIIEIPVYKSIVKSLQNFINKSKQKKAAEVTDLTVAEKQFLLQLLSEEAFASSDDALYYKDRSFVLAKKSDPDTEDGRAYFSNHQFCRKMHKQSTKRNLALAEIIRKLKRQVRTSP